MGNCENKRSIDEKRDKRKMNYLVTMTPEIRHLGHQEKSGIGAWIAPSVKTAIFSLTVLHPDFIASTSFSSSSFEMTWSFETFTQSVRNATCIPSDVSYRSKLILVFIKLNRQTVSCLLLSLCWKSERIPLCVIEIHRLSSPLLPRFLRQSNSHLEVLAIFSFAAVNSNGPFLNRR